MRRPPRTATSGGLAVALLAACGGPEATTGTSGLDADATTAVTGTTTTPTTGTTAGIDDVTSTATSAATSTGGAPGTTAAVDQGQPACESELGPGDHDLEIEHDGVVHRFHVHVPPAVEPGEALPVVLFFHGGGGNAEGAEETAQWIPDADAGGFVLVRAEGFDAGGGGRTWNAGACCGMAKALDIDHVGAVEALLDALSGQLCVDARRVFATGHSNGGMIAYRLGCELADRIAAVAPNAAFLMDQDLDGRGGPHFVCAPSRPVALLHLHGLADQCAPFDGGATPTDPAIRPPASHGIDVFRAANGCAPTSVPADAVGSTSCETWGACDAGADVTLCRSSEAGHVWPGSTDYPPTTKALCGGKTTLDIDANAMIWSFFTAHPLP